ncbi:biotin-dependent carboxyltransferase family protein [Virgibacillus doumboii]|uniref:5-oxoprolinase subunit C family protein n=1 Tax=Virgibacillus doumboii TaxID=2697503 RepID=UPI0013DF5DD6|nr:biotin-dependent carboxyltransferase family protein [Virgibacillus doumboii]
MQSQKIFHVIKPGVLTTFQDLGRTGYQKYGVPVSGAMDTYALQIANILAGNPRNKVCLEVTLVGPQLEMTAPHPITVAITGAALEPKLNNKPIQMWKSFKMEPGDQLTFGKHQSGVRAYIAVAGGFGAPAFFHSQSTDVNSGFGRSLAGDDSIYGFPVQSKHGVGISITPTYEKSIEVAVIEGPHTDSFTKEGRYIFFNTTHIVDANSNRMGYRLKSKQVTHEKNMDIWSDAVPFGGIQVPKNGMPIILMADRQTTGGYPRIGTVISSDLPKIAQLIPQGEIRFTPISVDEAQERARKIEKFLYQLEQFR